MRQLKITGLIIFLVCVLGVPLSHGEDAASRKRLLDDVETPWHISAEESLTYREKEGDIIAKGNVIFSKGNQFLYADEAIYNNKTGIADVSGNVRLESDGDTLTAESGTFNLIDQTGNVKNGRLFIKKNH